MSVSAADQYLLEMINRARLDPAAEAARFGISLNASLAAGTISTQAKQVLAPNQMLDSAATGHSLWMLATDTFSHSGAGASMPWNRASSAGYNWNACGENIAWTGTTGALALEASVESLHRSLFLSSSHRVNLLDATYREAGISVETGQFTSGPTYNAAMATELFGKSGSQVYLTGVAYGDSDGDKFYSMGEGRVGVSFAAGGQSDVTEAAGGYGLGLTQGSAVAVTGQVGALAFGCIVDFSVGNVKLDVVDGDTFFASGSVRLQTGIHDLTLLGVGNLSATGNGVANYLTGNAGDNVIIGAAGNDTVNGGLGNDRIYGGIGADSLMGRDGNDVLRGSQGDDALFGGNGNDRILGEAGHDRLSGNAGADVFVFADAGGRDMVCDFKLAEHDRLELDDAIWGGSAKTAAQVVNQFASVTAQGVLLDFGDGQSILLSGLTSTTGLAAEIVIL